eukprot:5158120-Prymnesium_polylepis.2
MRPIGACRRSAASPMAWQRGPPADVPMIWKRPPGLPPALACLQNALHQCFTHTSMSAHRASSGLDVRCIS